MARNFSYNNKRTLNKALIKEIKDLRKNPEFNKENLDSHTLDPRKSHKCFMAQGFGQRLSYSTHELSEKHRKKTGIVSDSESILGFECGDLTPLELWSALNWEKSHFEVLRVHNYLKNGGRVPKVSF